MLAGFSMNAKIAILFLSLKIKIAVCFAAMGRLNALQSNNQIPAVDFTPFD
jgi:hypothetical protein